MTFLRYTKDRLLKIIVTALLIFFIEGLLFIFGVNTALSILIGILVIITYVILFLLDYYRKHQFYKQVSSVMNNLDQLLLMTEIIDKPGFCEGNYFIDYFYEINKAYLEKLNSYKHQFIEFREYIELWCHEIKTPIATSKLILANKSGNNKEELDKIEDYVEQVLYYSRSELVEKDYIITDVSLKEVVNEVIKKNKVDLINKKIKVNLFNSDVLVKSDQKWLIFIINQIVNNSIKYMKDKDGTLNIDLTVQKNNVLLSIIDNGIGINEEEIPKVFDKGFTGTNGRLKYRSTGLGLYLCHKLCHKLGLKINIDSKILEYTKVTIIFPDSSMLNVFD